MGNSLEPDGVGGAPPRLGWVVDILALSQSSPVDCLMSTGPGRGEEGILMGGVRRGEWGSGWRVPPITDIGWG